MLDKVLDVLSVMVDKILYSRLFFSGFGLRRSPESDSFWQVTAKWTEELLEREEAKRDLTPNEEATLRHVKEISKMDDVEFDTEEAWRTKEKLLQEKAKGKLEFLDRATLNLVTRFFEEENKEKKMKLFREVRKRSV